MSYGNRFIDADRLDVTLAKFGILFCVLLLGLRLFASQVLLVVIPLAAGTACAVYVVTRERETGALAFPALPRDVVGFFPTVVFLGLTAVVASIQFYGERTGVTYLLTGLVGSLILIQILLAEDRNVAPGPVLFQILVAALVVRLTVLFSTPGVIGVDAWSHIPVYVDGVAETGSLAPLGDSKYIMAPFYHVVAAVGALVFGSARIGTYLTVGVLLPLSAILVYGTAKLLIPARWALLATALYAFSDQFIRWGIHLIPTSLGLVFFLGALYCVTKVFFTDDVHVVAMLMLFSLATVYTHQVSTAILLVLLGVAAFVSTLLSVTGNEPDSAAARSTPALVAAFLVTLVVTLVSWAITPWSGDSIFLWRMLEFLRLTLFESAGFLNFADENVAREAAGQTTGIVAQLIPYIEWFGFALLLMITVLGGLVMLRKDEPTDLALTYLLTAGTMFVAVFGLSLFGIRSLLPGRWVAFMYAPMAIIGAIGLFFISQNASRPMILVVFVVLAFGYPTTMVVGEKATLDNPAFEGEYPRFSYTETEIAAVDTVTTIRSPDQTSGAIRSDHPYRTVYERYGGFNAEIAEIREGGGAPADSSPTVYRDYQLAAPTVIYERGDPPVTHRSNTYQYAGDVCPPGRNHVYANEDVRLCTASSVTGEASA